MLDRIDRWLDLIESKWWGVIVVYFTLLITIYTTSWAILEPLGIPSQVGLLGSSIDRRILHVLFCFLAASHLTILLMLFLQWKGRLVMSWMRHPQCEPIFSNEMIAAFKSQNLCPERKDLIAERVLVKDKKISERDYANHVLWALHCNILDEKGARELLRGFKFDIRIIPKGLFTLVVKE